MRELITTETALWPLLEVRVCGWRPKRGHESAGYIAHLQPAQEHAPARGQGNALLDRERRAWQLEVRARVLFSPEPEPEPEPKSNLDGTRRRRR